MPVLIFLVCILLGQSVFAQRSQSIHLSPHENTFEIVLAANPSTGYQWTVIDFNKKLLKLQSSFFEQPKTKLIGAGGSMHFVFTLRARSKHPRATVIHFKYARDWEQNNISFKQVNVFFNQSTN